MLGVDFQWLFGFFQDSNVVYLLLVEGFQLFHGGNLAVDNYQRFRPFQHFVEENQLFPR